MQMPESRYSQKARDLGMGREPRRDQSIAKYVCNTSNRAANSASQSMRSPNIGTRLRPPSFSLSEFLRFNREIFD